jgi:hypothetical protein
MIAMKFKGSFRVGLVSFAALCLAGPLLAAESPVTLHSEPIMLDKIATVAGQTTHTLVDPAVTHDKVIPGSHLVVVTDYHNTSDKPVDHFVVTNPLPAALMLADDGMGDFEVSVDGGKSFGKLSALAVTDAKGGKRAAEASDVTALRWIIPQIAPGASGKLEYHAVVR